MAHGLDQASNPAALARHRRCRRLIELGVLHRFLQRRPLVVGLGVLVASLAAIDEAIVDGTTGSIEALLAATGAGL